MGSWGFRGQGRPSPSGCWTPGQDFSLSLAAVTLQRFGWKRATGYEADFWAKWVNGFVRMIPDDRRMGVMGEMGSSRLLAAGEAGSEADPLCGGRRAETSAWFLKAAARSVPCTHNQQPRVLEGCLLSECVFMGRPVFLVSCWGLEMNKSQSYTTPHPTPTHLAPTKTEICLSG